MESLHEKIRKAYAVHFDGTAYNLTPDELAGLAVQIVRGHFRHAAVAADRIAKDKAAA